jgi:hypothetical protein
VKRFCLLLALCCVVVPRVARADKAQEQLNKQAQMKAQAQLLFDDGRRLLDDGKTAEACDAFAESQRLDPAIGTQLNLANCYEKLGKTASAWINYVEVQTRARRAGQPERVEVAKKRADALEPQLSQMRVEVSAPVKGLSVTRDGAPVSARVWGKPTPVDPGEHEIRAQAPGKKPWTTKVTVGAERDEVSVRVPALADAPKPPPSKKTAAGEDDSGFGQMVGGWTSIAVGIAAGGVGVALRLVALERDDEASQFCTADGGTCTQEGADLRNEAQALQIGSVVAWAVGGALLVTGIVLVATVPSSDDPDAALLEWTVAGPNLGMRVRW